MFYFQFLLQAHRLVAIWNKAEETWVLLRVPNDSETDMWQKRLITILNIYLSQIGTKLLRKRENCVWKELKNFCRQHYL